ncbi:hypothetical protein PILCRDRAFT_602117 [Piloderma croceum F 1598]|uniref:Zn(2)-C6 fungal-type domain-containing protein n=1 Tax=Piloderma croceum (strain F 1598) TaxID=765440 RepID=A0A0C3BL29_PILCF|nr:hypothetical protein PILCRDRAFT_602117 [Piloderma croceum F 1598]
MDAKLIVMRTREPFACSSCSRAHSKCEKDYDKHGKPGDCMRCQTRGMPCKYPARSRTIFRKNPAPSKPAGNVTLGNQFMRRSDKSIRGARNRAGAAQCAMEILNIGHIVTHQGGVNTALSSTHYLSTGMRIGGSTGVAQPSHPGVLAVADTLFNPALSSGDFRMNLTGVRDEDLIRMIAAWSCSPCLCSERARCQFCIFEDCSTPAAYFRCQ